MSEPCVISLVTSDHPADFRCDLWSQLANRWAPGGFDSLSLESRQQLTKEILAEMQGITLPPRPDSVERSEQIAYQVDVLREFIVQGSLYFTSRLLLSPGFQLKPPPLDDCRGLWVYYAVFALDSLLRLGPVDSSDENQFIRDRLIEGVLHRLAHELPDVEFVERDSHTVYSKLLSDWEDWQKLLLPFAPCSGDATAPSTASRMASAVARAYALGDEMRMSSIGQAAFEGACEFIAGIAPTDRWRLLTMQVS